MSIGLPYTAMPVDVNSQLLLKDHFKWLNRRKQIEIDEQATANANGGGGGYSNSSSMTPMVIP
eukprot:scaffold102_cov103-Cylindrotheca_fusiformis.AAC.2